MPIFPYNDEEEERRRRRMLPSPVADLAMGELESAKRPPVLPEVEMGRPGMSAAGMPGALPPPTINRQGRGQEIGEARDAYLERTPGRGRSALTGALQGFLGGGGLAGAIMGGASGAIDPRGLREQEFNRKIRPRIEERFGYEDQERALTRQTEQDALNNQYRTAQIGELESQAYKNRLPPPAPRPISTPGGALGPDGKIIPGTAPPPRPETPPFSSSPLGIYDRRTGKVTTPAKEKASGGGGSSTSSSKDKRAANVEMRMFQRLKGEADRANREGDTEVFAAKMAELQDTADRIDALYGDTVEVGVGEGGWPYVKFRQSGKATGRQGARPAAKDPLGIR